MPNFIEVQPPGSGRLFVVLRVITSGDRIPFTPLDYVPLDLVHSPDCGFGEELLQGVRIAGSTYVVSFSTAPRMG